MNTKQAEAYILFKLLDKPIDPFIKYVAVDRCGDVYGFAERPYRPSHRMWDSRTGILCYLFKLPEPFLDWDCTVIKLNNE